MPPPLRSHSFQHFLIYGAWLLFWGMSGGCVSSKYHAVQGAEEPTTEQEEPLVTERSSRLAKRVSGLMLKSTLLIAPEDVLEIKVADQPELSGTVKVDPWGFIKVPYIKGLQVNGLTVDKVESLLIQKYSDFFKNPPEIEVSVIEYNSHVIYVLGSVDKPGKYPLIKGRPHTLRDAIVEAGLPTPRAALWRVWIVRQTESGPVSMHVNFGKILYRGRFENNLELQPGDIVFVPMGILDTVVTFIGRLFGSITGVGRSLITGAPAAL